MSFSQPSNKNLIKYYPDTFLFTLLSPTLGFDIHHMLLFLGKKIQTLIVKLLIFSKRF